MSEPSLSDSAQDKSGFLSPKQKIERLKHNHALQKLDQQLATILTSTKQELQSHASLIENMTVIESSYLKEIQQLKTKMNRKERQHQMEVQQYRHNLELMDNKYRLLEEQFIGIQDQYDHQHYKIVELQQDKEKYKKMIASQESLLLEYKQSIEDQINLEKQFLKSIYEQKQLKVKNDYSKALENIENNYEQKLKNRQIKENFKSYKEEVKAFKFFMEKTKRDDIKLPQKRKNRDRHKKLKQPDETYQTVPLCRNIVNL